MIIDFKNKPYETNVLWICFLCASVAAIASMLVQIFLNTQPCYLCMTQRWLYISSVPFAVIGLYSKHKDNYLWILLIILSLEFGISAYHILVQIGVVADPCIVPTPTSLDDFWKVLKTPSPCSKINWSFLGLPLSAYNFAISSSLLAFLSRFVYFKMKPSENRF